MWTEHTTLAAAAVIAVCAIGLVIYWIAVAPFDEDDMNL